MGNPLNGSWNAGGTEPGSEGFSGGFFSDFGAEASAVYATTSRNRSMLGLESEVLSRWEESTRRYQKLTGQDPGDINNLATVYGLVNPIISPNKERWAGQFTHFMEPEFDPVSGPAIDAQRLVQAKKINDQIRALGDPSVKSIEDILKEVVESRGQRREDEASISATSGWGGTFGGFAGGMAGSFTTRDPLNLLTFGFGGFGKTAAAKIGTEMLAGVGVELAAQELAIRPTETALGEEHAPLLQDLFYAGLGAGVIRGAGVGLGKLTGRGLRSNPLDPFDASDDHLLREMFGANIKDPDARAGNILLDEHQAFTAANPYGESPTGYRRFTGEMEDIYNVVQGRTESAVGRILPIEEFNFENLSLDTQIVREQRPDIFERLQIANQAIQSIDERIAQVTNQIDNMSIADAVERVDIDTGMLVRSLEKDLEKPGLTEPQRIDLARRIDVIVKSLGEERIAQEFNDASIAPTKELQRLRQSRKAATKEFKAARNEMDGEVKRVQVEAQIKQMLGPKPAIQSGPIHTFPINPSALRYDVISSHRTSVEAAALVEEKTPTNLTEVKIEDEPTAIDLGNGKTVPPDFHIEDPDNPGNQISAAELLARNEADALQDEAVRTCSL